jgi:hypothetical protein
MPDITGRTALETLKNVVEKISVPFASLLLSPMGSLATQLLATAFGGEGSTLMQLAAKISDDPEAIAKIKALENEHQTAIEKINSENFKTEVDDRKSAREREIQLKDHVPTILAIGFLINYAALQFYCVTHPSNIIDIMSARFQDVLMLIMSYYFGSSYKKSQD